MTQLDFGKKHWKHRFSHGGILRNQRAGRQFRPLSGRDPIHLVLKANRDQIRSGFRSYKRYFMIQNLVQKYSHRFFVKVEQISIQGDHIHLLIRATRRSNCQAFLRVVPGQIAQELLKKNLVTDTPSGGKGGLWKLRPFTRVVKGWKAYRLVRDYIQLNEREALGEIPYQKQRLKGLSSQQRWKLWDFDV